MENLNLAAELAINEYPGRGIVLGLSKDGKNAVIAYFIMGRSANSRNRVFTPANGGIITEAADPARKVFSGPNTDLIVPWFDRNDGYHFSAKAADHFSAAWMPLLARGGDMAQATP